MIGVVLAGGASRRMGLPKAQVDVGGAPMAAYVARALREVCDDVVASGGPADDLEVIPDGDGTWRHGPLAGLVAVLRRFEVPIVAVAVDQPWVRVATLQGLVRRYAGRCVVPLDQGSRQVTCAIYAPEVLADAEAALSGGSIQSVLDATDHVVVEDWHLWGEDGRSWFSVDAPQDIEEGIRRYGTPAPAR